MKSFKSQWVKLIARNLEGYQEIAQRDVFDRWDELIMHEGQVESQFTYGIELFCGDTSRSLPANYFARAIALSKRAFSKEAFKKRKSRGFFPLNRGRIARGQRYARWFLEGKLDSKLLVDGSADILAWCEKISDGEWESINQNWYLSAVTMAIVGMSPKELETLSRNLRPCRARAPHFAAVESIMVHAFNQDSEIPVTKFDACFDRIRKPRNADCFTAFEMAALRVIYIEGRTDREVPYIAVDRMSA